MLKSLTLAAVLAATALSLGSVTASAASHTTAAQCQAFDDMARRSSRSDRTYSDAYIHCLNAL